MASRSLHIPWAKFAPLGLMLLLLLAILSMGQKQHRPLDAELPPFQVYHGAYIASDSPTINQYRELETRLQKGFAIIQWYQTWEQNETYQSFNADWADTIRAYDAIPLVTWLPSDANNTSIQRDYSLQKILAGDHDEYINEWFAEVAGWGQPIFVRFAPDMNTEWYPWSESTNGNSLGEYTKVWQKVVSMARSNGAKNITWVWCPRAGTTTLSLGQFYPGHDYVDWTCMSGLNSENHLLGSDELFSPLYKEIMLLAGSKPMMIAELSTHGDIAYQDRWYSDLISEQIPRRFTAVKGIIWYHGVHNQQPYSLPEQTKKHSSLSDSLRPEFYVPNIIKNLDRSPIPAPYQLLKDTNTEQQKEGNTHNKGK